MGIGLLEIVVIGVAALVLLGPERLPDVLKQVGRFYVQLRRTSAEFRNAFDGVVKQAEHEVQIEEVKRLTALIEATKKSISADPSQLLDDHLKSHDTTNSETSPVPLARHADAANAWSLSPEEKIPSHLEGETSVENSQDVQSFDHEHDDLTKKTPPSPKV